MMEVLSKESFPPLEAWLPVMPFSLTAEKKGLKEKN